MKSKISYIVFLFILIGILFATFLLLPNKEEHNNNLKMYFFKAGKADATLIYNNEFAALIDTGEEELGNEILNYLRREHIEKIDLLIITHFDKDHVGSASQILDSVKVDKVIQSNYKKKSGVYDKYVEALNRNNINYETLRQDTKLVFGEVTFIINAPLKNEYEDSPSNNSSLITRIYYNNTSLLFTGDAQDERIEEFLANSSEKYDFLKVPYHGHFQDSFEKLIVNINPKYAVITSSDEEKEDKKTLDILSKYHVNTYLTRSHAVLAILDGNSIIVRH